MQGMFPVYVLLNITVHLQKKHICITEKGGKKILFTKTHFKWG